MKQVTIYVTAVLASGLLLTACSQKKETPSATTPPVAPEVTKAPATMQDLVAIAKDGVAKAMALAKEGKYQEALTLLQQTSQQVQASPDAKQLVDNSIAQVKQMMADAAAKAASQKVSNALGGLGK